MKISYKTVLTIIFVCGMMVGTGCRQTMGTSSVGCVRGVVRGPDRLTDIASIPVVDFGSRIRYAGSISPDGDNADWDWGEVQDENGEWILFEDVGPGCIWNFTQHRDEVCEVPIFRFYFDGEKTPRLTARPKDFGAIPQLPKPLAGAFEATANNRPFRIVRSFVPMPYVKGVRVTSSVKLRGTVPNGGWGHVLSHRYASDVGVSTYDPLQDHAAFARAFERPLGVKAERSVMGHGRKIATGESVEIFSSGRRGTIVEMALEFSEFNTAVLSGAWVVCTFDGEKTVEAPLGTFFGCERPGKPAKLETVLMTFDTSAEPAAHFSNRFPMPYFESCQVVLENRSSALIVVDTAVNVNESIIYDRARTGIFTASTYCPRTRNVLGKNARIGRLVGRGALAYGVISGYDFNPTPWGTCEGDVRCFIDDMTVPCVQSDGSESWGSWGWGFIRPGSCNVMSWYHSPDNGVNSWSELRLTYADAYVFNRFLRFDLEHGMANDHPESASSGQIFAYVLPRFECTR